VIIRENTNLEELGLVSFNSASNGVIIVQNPALCYVDSISDRKAFTRASLVVKTNRPADQCSEYRSLDGSLDQARLLIDIIYFRRYCICIISIRGPYTNMNMPLV